MNEISAWLFISGFLIFSVNSGTTCSPVLCSSTSSLTTCMEYTNSTSSYSAQACATTNYTCPNPVHMSTLYPLVCEYWIDSRFWNSTSWSNYYQYSILSLNENCDPYGIVSVCDSSSGLVCYCPNGPCYCTNGLKYGDECEINPIPCMPGFVCSNKVCTKMYSLDAGTQATNSLACVGGGPLVINNGEFQCRQGPQTLGGIPKTCSSDSDCISDTGSQITVCTCGLNTDGIAYCSLQYNDPPMVNWRNAERDGEYKLEIYWKFISINYPYLQGNIDSCLGDVWRDFYEYKLGVPTVTSEGEIIKVVGFSIMLISILS